VAGRTSSDAQRRPAGISPGEQRLSRDFVREMQRQRILEPLAELAHERGIADTTASAVVNRAKMSRAMFYELFGDRSGALRFAFAQAYDFLSAPVRDALTGSRSWPEQVHHAIGGLIGAAVDNPLLAELCLVHSPGGRFEARGNDYEAIVATLVGALAGGREAGRATSGEEYRDPPPVVEEFLARSILSMIRLRLTQGNAAQLPAQRDELFVLTMVPFFGPEEALRLCSDLNAA